MAKENEVKLNEKNKLMKMEQEKALLNVEVECLKREMNEKNKELNKERSKIENMIRHEQVSASLIYFIIFQAMFVKKTRAFK